MKRWLAIVLVLLLLIGCAAAAPTPTIAPTNTTPPTATATSAPAETPMPTQTPAPTATSTPVPTATPTVAPAAPPTPKSLPTTVAPEPTVSSEQQGEILAAEVSSERLMKDVSWLADDARQGRLAGSPGANAARDYIVQRVEDLGLKPFAAAGLDGYTEPFPVPAVSRYGRAAEGDTAEAYNVIAVLPGTTRSDRYVFIAAHYDHIGVLPDGQVNNGADDDATGVAAVLEAARIFSEADVRPQETLVFALFSGEELGALGSAAFCDQLTAAGLTNESLVLNLEVLGAKPGAGTYLDVWDEAFASTGPLVSAVEESGQELGIRIQQQGRDPGSDAVQLLYGCGVPAVSLDVAWSAANHPNYHRPTDDPQNIDVEGFTNAARVATSAVWLLANDGK
jgi:Zn-dependent M28 family amino/carboxypeptidase